LANEVFDRNIPNNKWQASNPLVQRSCRFILLVEGVFGMQGKGCVNFPGLAEWPIKRRDCDSDASSKSKLWSGPSHAGAFPETHFCRHHFEPFFLIHPPPQKWDSFFFQGGVIRKNRAAKFAAWPRNHVIIPSNTQHTFAARAPHFRWLAFGANCLLWGSDFWIFVVAILLYNRLHPHSRFLPSNPPITSTSTPVATDITI